MGAQADLDQFLAPEWRILQEGSLLELLNNRVIRPQVLPLLLKHEETSAWQCWFFIQNIETDLSGGISGAFVLTNSVRDQNIQAEVLLQ